MRQYIAIDSLVDANGDKIVIEERTVDYETLYQHAETLSAVTQTLESRKQRALLGNILKDIKLAYFCDLLKAGVVLDPIRVEGNVLKDGKHRLIAHVLSGKKEINFLEKGQCI